MPMSILLFSGGVHLLTAAFLYTCHHYVQPFDSSANIIGIKNGLLRWDAFHFAHIARFGYVYEYEWAFFPGVPSILGLVAPLAPSDTLFLVHALLLIPISIFSTYTFHELSLITLRSTSLARLATLLSLLPSSPITLRLAPYAEGWFTCATYRGMLHCARKEWVKASMWFMLAGFFRSNSITLAGFILWGMFIEPSIQGKGISVARLCHTILLVGPVFAPFIFHHLTAYLAFCLAEKSITSPPEWCTRPIPSIYSYVQAKYWNVGLFNYWTLQQLPNFIIAAPVLSLLFSFGLWYLRGIWTARKKLLGFERSAGKRQATTTTMPGIDNNPFLSPSLVPHVIHAIFIVIILFIASHTQIALRLVASLPTTYWASAWLFFNPAKSAEISFPGGLWAHVWVWWSFLWGGISIVLWMAFLPPA